MCVVNEDRIRDLTAILKKLNSEGITEATRTEALNIVTSIDPIELAKYIVFNLRDISCILQL
jgi:hypothetical protein